MKRRDFVKNSTKFTSGISATLLVGCGSDSSHSENINAMAAGEYIIGHSGHDCDFDSAGNCYELFPQDHTIIKKSPDGKIVWQSHVYNAVDSQGFKLNEEGKPAYTPNKMNLNFPTEVYVRNGKTFVVDSGDYRVVVFNDADGQYLGEIKGSDTWPLSRVSDLALDGENNIYILDSNHHQIQVFDFNGNFLRRFGRLAVHREDIFAETHNLVFIDETGPIDAAGKGGLNAPLSCAFDTKERLHVIDSIYDRVIVFSKDGEELFTYEPENSDPFANTAPYYVSSDKRGWIYISDYSLKKVLVFHEDGKFHSDYDTKQGEIGVHPMDLEFSENGILYINARKVEE